MSGEHFTNRFEKDRFYVAIGNRVTATREAAGLTQHQLAAKARLSQATVLNVETAKTCSVLTLAKLAEALDVLIDELVPLEATKSTAG